MIPNPHTRVVRRTGADGRPVIVGIEAPVRGVGLRTWHPTTSSPDDMALLAAAIPVINGASDGADLSPAQRARLIELGILIARRQRAQPSRLSCPLVADGDAPADLLLAAGVRYAPDGQPPPHLALVTDGLDLAGPTAWVEDPVSRVAFPYRVPARWTRALGALLAGGPIAALSPEARSAFHAAGILITPAELRAHARRAETIRGRAHDEWRRQRATTPFAMGVPAPQLRALRRHFDALESQGWFGPSLQAPGRVVIYDEPVAAFVHRQMGPLVSALAGAPWRPSYCYVARYHQGADLAPHVDREQCALTISLQIELTAATDRRSAWPLKVALPRPDGRREVLAARMLDGEGAAFDGTALTHWRDPLPAGTGTYLFMHFVEASFRGALH